MDRWLCMFVYTRYNSTIERINLLNIWPIKSSLTAFVLFKYYTAH